MVYNIQAFTRSIIIKIRNIKPTGMLQYNTIYMSTVDVLTWAVSKQIVLPTLIV